MDKPEKFSLVLGDQAYSCALIPYGKTTLYPCVEGVFVVVRLGADQQTLSVVSLFANFTEKAPLEKLHNLQVAARKPTHVLFYPKRVSESLLEFYNQCQDCYPPELNEQDILAQGTNVQGANNSSSNALAQDRFEFREAASQQCTVCSGGGRSICSACGGAGGRQVMNSHIGHDGNPVYEPEWECCYSCSGGYVNCSACGGSG